MRNVGKSYFFGKMHAYIVYDKCRYIADNRLRLGYSCPNHKQKYKKNVRAHRLLKSEFTVVVFGYYIVKVCLYSFVFVIGKNGVRNS